MTKENPIISLLIITLSMMLGGCGSAGSQRHGTVPAQVRDASNYHRVSYTHEESKAVSLQTVLDLRKTSNLDDIIRDLSNKRVVYVGETHTSYGHHLTQLEIIKRLHRLNPNIAVGMEYFQQPFQPILDDYIAGNISESEMLKKTKWYENWRYDFRLYQDIMQYAHKHKIPVIALNVSTEIRERVSAVGFEGLNQTERKQAPLDIDQSDQAYADRLRTVFNRHPGHEQGDFNRFLQVQLLWDEGMAEQAANWLHDNPDKQMVVLAGSGHLMYGSGIPQRVRRRLTQDTIIVLPGDTIEIRPGIADFVIYPTPVELPKQGVMGILLEQSEDGVLASKVFPGSTAEKAGVKVGDLIKSVYGKPVSGPADIKIAMLGKPPGDRISIVIIRERMLLGDELLELEFPLGEE